VTARARRSERGAALLVAIISIAVLTALAVDLAYESRVSLRIAANARDELRASYLARSGVTLSRLVLSFQQKIDQMGGAASQAAGGMSIPRIQLWQLVPIDSDLAAAFFGGPAAAAPPEGEGGAPPGRASLFLEADDAGARAAEPRPGRFDAAVDDEARKVNMQFDASGALLAPRVQALYQLVCDPRWDVLFDREDANGIRVSREELLVHLRDWVDEDSTGVVIRAASGGTHCALLVQGNAFDPAYGDENQPYDRGEDRYRAKNARMDSLDELFMIAGIGDAFIGAFRDSLTVYLPRDGVGSKRNVNDVDPVSLLVNAIILADGRTDRRVFLEPEFVPGLQTLVMTQTFGGKLAITVGQFAEIVKGMNVTINESLVSPQNVNSPFTDRSTTFRIRASGKSGDVTNTIDTVVRLETTPAVPNAPVAAPGRVVHWKEE
jgi:general secretion pathway protein K